MFYPLEPITTSREIEIYTFCFDSYSNKILFYKPLKVLGYCNNTRIHICGNCGKGAYPVIEQIAEHSKWKMARLNLLLAKGVYFALIF